MRLVGIVTGEFNGKKYAKCLFEEDMTRSGCYGKNVIVSKAQYDYIHNEIVPDVDLYLNEDVNVLYDRFGRIQYLTLCDSHI